MSTSTSAGVHRTAQYQQRLEELASASVRALAADSHLAFRRGVLCRDDTPLPAHAPHLRVPPQQRDLATLRSLADAQALRIRYSDNELFQRQCPQEPMQRLVFEMLEQFRAESLVPADLPGVRANLHRRFFAWSKAFHEAELTDTAAGKQLFTFAQMAWSRLNAVPVFADTEDFIETSRGKLGAHIGVWLAGLRRHRFDQEAFGLHALALARYLAADLHSRLDDDTEEDNAEEAEVDDSRLALAVLLDFDGEVADLPAAVLTGHSAAFELTSQRYRVYTTEYDEEVHATSLVRAALLTKYRKELDALVSQQRVSRFRLLRLLTQALATPVREGWLHGEEEGIIDGRRLANLVSAPMQRDIFMQERFVPQAHCAVTFLMDSSGSMKDHARPLAVLVDIMVRALEHIGVTTEVLGFSTRAWNGGRAYRQWQRSDRPRLPGRMNELSHRVLKDARQPWRKERAGMASLFRANLFREGVDGEAVLWAASRMFEADVARRIMVVISDGCPMDTATNLLNDDYYLDNHLKQVVAGLERHGQIEFVGLGVGLDLGPFYRKNLALDLSGGLHNDALYELAALLGR